MTLSVATVEDIAVAFETLVANGPQIVTSIRAGNAQGYLQTAEDVAGLIGIFIPGAAVAAQIIAVLIAVEKLREAGFWAPADDPAALNQHNQPTSAG